jgi:hypothetical protein
MTTYKCIVCDFQLEPMAGLDPRSIGWMWIAHRGGHAWRCRECSEADEQRRLTGKYSRRPLHDGLTFGAIAVGQVFEFDGRTWTKIDRDSATSTKDDKMHFDGSWSVTIKNPPANRRQR